MNAGTKFNDAASVRTTLLPSGRPIPVLGQGTWRMGEDSSRRQAEIDALAWLLRHPELVVIPKAGKAEHIRDNRAAHDIQLTDSDLKELDQAFRPPKRKIPLEML